MKIFILYSLWIIYSALEGFIEGYLWQYKEESVKYGSVLTKLHSVFDVKRFIVAILILLNIKISMLDDFLFFLCLGGSFSFFHNGIMYMARNNISKDVYIKRFKDQSISSTSDFELTFSERLILFIISTILIIFIYAKVF